MVIDLNPISFLQKMNPVNLIVLNGRINWLGIIATILIIGYIYLRLKNNKKRGSGQVNYRN